MTNKFNARGITADGYHFDSQKEFRRYCDLLLMVKSGDISSLVVHPVYVLQEGFITAKGERIQPIKYIADFSYIENGQTVIEDVKGGIATQTAEFRIKAKLFKKVFDDPCMEFRVLSE